MPFWGFPLALVLVSLLVLGIVIGISGRGDSSSSRDSWRPGFSQTVSNKVTAPAPPPQTGNPGAAASPAPAPAAPVVPVQPASASSGSLSPGGEVPGPGAVFVFKSYGRAHGVGLCMDGVRYRAQDGQSYLEILGYYYTGVTIQQIDDSKPIRVKGRDGQVRTLPMKEYLYHLAEEPEDYPAEGLKVLYIAARTYTLSCIARGKHTGQGFDICSSGECCQAFNETKDLSKSPNNIAAVDATSGQALFYNGAPITAAYCGSCGGHTENNEDVWGGQPIPYLRGKPDAFCSRSPRFCAALEISATNLQGKLGVGQLKLVDLSNRTPGGRVRKVRIVGSAGTREMAGKDFVKLLGLKNTRFDYAFK